MTVEVQPPDQLRPSWSRGSSLFVAAFAAVAIALGFIAWWVLTPSALDENAGGAFIPGTTAPGTTDYIGTGIAANPGDVPGLTMSIVANGPPVEVGPTPPPTPVVTIDIVEARPNITENTSNATVELLRCVHRGNSGGIGSGHADVLHQVCSSVEKFTSGNFTVDDHNSLVLAITPRQAGTVHVDGVTIDYRDGLRRGTQTVGVTVDVRS